MISVWLFRLCCKTNPWRSLSASEIQQLQIGQAFGLCAFLTAHREPMDWFVSLRRLFKNTPCCDAHRAALEAGIQPGILLYKWSGPHWFKVYTINAINMGFRRVTTWMSISPRAELCHNGPPLPETVGVCARVSALNIDACTFSKTLPT